jgi:hypothetical protein
VQTLHETVNAHTGIAGLRVRLAAAAVLNTLMCKLNFAAMSSSCRRGTRLFERVCCDAVATGWLAYVTASLACPATNPEEVSAVRIALSWLTHSLKLQHVRSHLQPSSFVHPGEPMSVIWARSSNIEVQRCTQSASVLT